MKLKKIIVSNYKSIIKDAIEFEDFTFLIGRNNNGKSNYLKSIDSLLSFSKTYNNISQIQNDTKLPVIIEGWFDDIKSFTPKLTDGKHKDAVEKLIDSDGLIRLRLTIQPDGLAETRLVDPKTNSPKDVTGRESVKSLFPETIFIPATADTTEELQERSTSALSKIKKVVMEQFFSSLSNKVDDAFKDVDKFVNGTEKERSADLKEIENDFAKEMMGEFSNVQPKFRFTMPDTELVGKGMKINLDDGFHECEIEQKGNGLQRTALFGLIRLLSKHNNKESLKPSPIFLIEELEAFLHPSAQKKLAEDMSVMSKKYQTIVTTHSPFVLNPDLLTGYRKVIRTQKDGTKCMHPDEKELRGDYEAIKNSLVYTNNLISIFSDNVAIVEGINDVGFYNTTIELLNIADREKIVFVNSTGGGNSGIHISCNYFKTLKINNISVICDLDCLFDLNFKLLLKDFKINDEFVDIFRKKIKFDKEGQPGSEYVLENINKLLPKDLDSVIDKLAKKNIFVLKKGTPENYYDEKFVAKNETYPIKSLWQKISNEMDIKYKNELKSIFNAISK